MTKGGGKRSRGNRRKRRAQRKEGGDLKRPLSQIQEGKGRGSFNGPDVGKGGRRGRDKGKTKEHTLPMHFSAKRGLKVTFVPDEGRTVGESRKVEKRPAQPGRTNQGPPPVDMGRQDRGKRGRISDKDHFFLHGISLPQKAFTKKQKERTKERGFQINVSPS